MDQTAVIVKPKSTSPSFLKTFGIGKEKEFFLENLSLMLGADMPVSQALKAMTEAVESKQLAVIVKELESDINNGLHFWEAFGKTGLFPDYAISLIRIGEESGRLNENLKLLSKQQEKDRVLTQRIRSAMIYPAIVLVLTLVLGTGIAWFILPRLATVFSDLNLKLPLLTKLLIGLGGFLSKWGLIVVPWSVILLVVAFYFVFVFKRTKFLGQKLLFVLPGVKDLILEVELSRFGYILGGLLGAGVPLVDSLELLSQAATFENYKRLFRFLKLNVEEGNSFKKSFAAYKNLKKLVPVPVQQIVIAGELSGKLEQTFLTLGKNYEEKSETTSQNLTVILEPVLLVIVWVGVAVVALAVILPLYGLIGGLQIGSAPPPRAVNIRPPAVEPAGAKTATTTPVVLPSGAIRGANIENVDLKVKVVFGINFLNTRTEPDVSSAVVSKIYPGQTFRATQKQEGWFKIVLKHEKEAWVSADYVKVQ